MRISQKQLRRIIREAVRSRLCETYYDITDIAVRLRVNVTGELTVLDLLTSIRGIPNVITVTQKGTMDPAPDGKNMINLLVAFEDNEFYDLPDLERDLKDVEGVDMVRILGTQEREDDA